MKILGWTRAQWREAHKHASRATTLAEYLDRLKNALERSANA